MFYFSFLFVVRSRFFIRFSSVFLQFVRCFLSLQTVCFIFCDFNKKKRRRNKTTTTEKKTPTKAKKKKNQRERDNKKSTDVLYEINIKIKMNRATPIRANDVFVKLTSIPCCAFEMRSAATTTKKINADMHVYENSLLGLSPLALLTVCAQTYLVLYFTLIYLLSLLVVCHWYDGFFYFTLGCSIYLFYLLICFLAYMTLSCRLF